MTQFEDFSKDLEKLVEKYSRNHALLKVENNFDDDIIKIFGEKITALARAKNGLAEVTEMAYTTAEHHPYWSLLYNASEIITVLLEKWNGQISKEEIEEFEWSIKELTQNLNKIKDSSK